MSEEDVTFTPEAVMLNAGLNPDEDSLGDLTHGQRAFWVLRLIEESDHEVPSTGPRGKQQLREIASEALKDQYGTGVLRELVGHVEARGRGA